MIICDTSGLLAAYADSEPEGPLVRDLLDAEAGALVVSPFVLAELDYLLLTRGGTRSEVTLLDDLADQVYQVAAVTPRDAERTVVLAGRHADLKLGIADAHTMNLTAPDRYATTRVLTFDERHFRAVRPPRGGVFTVPPADL